tara:strand:+ start:2045 stop:2287 length:243 start_codon:yes stop_codon:yes gene_type:complete
MSKEKFITPRNQIDSSICAIARVESMAKSALYVVDRVRSEMSTADEEYFAVFTTMCGLFESIQHHAAKIGEDIEKAINSM